MTERVVILGAGLTGQSCLSHCLARGMDCTLVEPDSSRKNALSREDIHASGNWDLVFGDMPASLLRSADVALVSPGLPPGHRAVRDLCEADIAVHSDLDWFCAAAEAPVIGITGTNGKTTVTSVLAQMVKDAGFTAAAGGNIGAPALGLLDEKVDYYLLEISSFQLEYSAGLPLLAGAVLNLSADHIDRHFSMRRYAGIKRRIYDRAQRLVCNSDDPATWPEPWHAAPVSRFGLSEPDAGQYGLKDGRLCCGRTPLMEAAEVRLPGAAGGQNALAALATGRAIGLPEQSMLRTLRSDIAQVQPHRQHRLNLIAEQAGVRWIDDSKATNPMATAAAIEALTERAQEASVILIAGGDAKQADMRQLQPAVAGQVRLCCLIGRDAPALQRQFAGLTETVICRTMAEAVGLAAQRARSGDTVLLSPACASMDQYQNYRQRGAAFAACVAEQLS